MTAAVCGGDRAVLNGNRNARIDRSIRSAWQAPMLRAMAT